jgi:hypothetical protein
MSVLLARSRAHLSGDRFDRWCATDPRLQGFDPACRVTDLTGLIEQAFDAIAEEWWAIGKRLGAEPSGELAHAPACAANASDFGVMLAWSRLVHKWAGETPRVAVLCDDPWLFRHLARIPGVAAGAAPPLTLKRVALGLRGFAARTKVAVLSLRAALRLGGQRARYPAGAPAILVYGHPASDAKGRDAYFGHLMSAIPGLARVLHVDCGIGRAQALGADGRTFSLHAWGHPFGALTLPFVKWRPSAAARSGEHGWLVRRAAAMEGATGQAAQIAWQKICQRAWLRAARPAAVAWPWENHAWERDFVRAARTAGIATIGYQHSTVGRR